MAEKQKVKAVVVDSDIMFSVLRISGQQKDETFMWPYPIPAGTQVTITVEKIGGK